MNRRYAAALAVFAVAALALSGCAPEPMVGNGGKGDDPSSEVRGTDGSSWSERDPLDDPMLKTKTLPAGFPVDRFTIPDTSSISDAGERGQGVWFVVLETDSFEAATELWDQIVAMNGLSGDSKEETSDGGWFEHFESPAGLVIDAAIVPEGESFLISYDLREAF